MSGRSRGRPPKSRKGGRGCKKALLLRYSRRKSTGNTAIKPGTEDSDEGGAESPLTPRPAAAGAFADRTSGAATAGGSACEAHAAAACGGAGAAVVVSSERARSAKTAGTAAVAGTASRGTLSADAADTAPARAAAVPVGRTLATACQAHPATVRGGAGDSATARSSDVADADGNVHCAPRFRVGLLGLRIPLRAVERVATIATAAPAPKAADGVPIAVFRSWFR